MLKLLLAQNFRSSPGYATKYFLDFADAVNADVTIVNPCSGKDGVAARMLSGAGDWLCERFIPKGCFGRSVAREAVKSSQIFSYDLILAGRERKRGWFGKHPTRHLSKMAWAPVMLIPEKVVFKPFRNILFIDDQELITKQPVLEKLIECWRQKHFLYPVRRRRYGRGSYHSRRFDETGFPVYPQFDIGHLWQYIQLHQIGLLVTNANRADSHILEKLPVPLLSFNSRSIANSPSTVHTTAFAAQRKRYGKEGFKTKSK